MFNVKFLNNNIRNIAIYGPPFFSKNKKNPGGPGFFSSSGGSLLQECHPLRLGEIVRGQPVIINPGRYLLTGIVAAVPDNAMLARIHPVAQERSDLLADNIVDR